MSEPIKEEEEIVENETPENPENPDPEVSREVIRLNGIQNNRLINISIVDHIWTDKTHHFVP